MKKRKYTALILAAGLAFALTAPVLAASEITAGRELEFAELPGLDVNCAPSGIYPTEDGGLMVTDTYSRVIWKVKDGQCTLYAGGSSLEDPYGQPVGGYHDTALGQSLAARTMFPTAATFAVMSAVVLFLAVLLIRRS